MNAAQPSDAPGADAARERARRERLAEIFGEELPEQVRDDADAARGGGGGVDDWLREQVPPHHG